MSRETTDWTGWGVRFRTKDGPEHLLKRGYVPALFATKREAMEWIEQEFGYIRHREDLRRPPHNWRMPKAVRVWVEGKEGG